MFGLFKKKFSVDDLFNEIKKIHNSVEDYDERHRKIYVYCDELQTTNLDIVFNKRLFQSLSFMESAKLRDELSDFDKQRNLSIIQGICMEVARRMKVYPLQLIVTFQNYCEFLVKNNNIKEIHTILFYILSGIRQIFNSAIDNQWSIDELIIRNRILMTFYSIGIANLSNVENTYGLSMDAIYNNVSKNNLDTFYTNNIIYTFIPSYIYSEDNLDTIIWDETLDNILTINISLDKPIPKEYIIINPNNNEAFSCFLPVILTGPDITTDTPSFFGEILSPIDVEV